MAFMGMAPFGSLLAGTLAGLIGRRTRFSSEGSCALQARRRFQKNILSVKGLAHLPEKELTPRNSDGNRVVGGSFGKPVA